MDLKPLTRTRAAELERPLCYAIALAGLTPVPSTNSYVMPNAAALLCDLLGDVREALAAGETEASSDA